jgi:hypothetical protein
MMCSYPTRPLLSLLTVSLLTAGGACTAPPQSPHSGGREAGEQGAEQPGPISGARQLTFAGRRSGEGYFSKNGSRLVFQSERHEGNPFYQIYRMDMDRGDVERVSPGFGKTTCGWIHPGGERVLFASTHLDPEARAKQEREIEERAAGTQRRYSWDYDEHYDLFAGSVPAIRAAHEEGRSGARALRRLTSARCSRLMGQ